MGGTQSHEAAPRGPEEEEAFLSHELDAARAAFNRVREGEEALAQEGESNLGQVLHTALGGSQSMRRSAQYLLCGPFGEAHQSLTWTAFLRGLIAVCKLPSRTRQAELAVRVIRALPPPCGGAAETDDSGERAAGVRGTPLKDEELRSLLWVLWELSALADPALVPCRDREKVSEEDAAVVAGLVAGLLAGREAVEEAEVVQWLVETLPHAATALAAVLRSCLLTIHTRPTPPTAAPPATSIASGCAHPAEEEADGAALLASLQWVLWGLGMVPNVMDTSAPDLLYRAALHGFGMNRFVGFTAIGAYSPDRKVKQLRRVGVARTLEAELRLPAPPGGGGIQAHVTGYQAVCLLLVRAEGGLLVAAVVEGGFVGAQAFGKHTLLLPLQPCFSLLRPRVASGGAGHYGYCIDAAAAAATQARPGTSRRGPPGGGLGVGGNMEAPRVALDAMFQTVTLRRYAAGDLFPAANLHPQCATASSVVRQVQGVEVWGLGGLTALQDQHQRQDRHKWVIQQQRKVDRAAFGETWKDSPDRLLMDLVSGATDSISVGDTAQIERQLNAAGSR